MFYTLGKFIFRHRWPTLITAGVLLALALVALSLGGKLTGGTVKGLEAERADQLVATVAGRSADNTFVALFRSQTLAPGTPDFDQAMEAALAPLRSDPTVASVQSTADVDAETAGQRRNAADKVAFALVTIKGELKEALAAYPAIRAELKADTLDITTTGRIPFMENLNSTLEVDLQRAELISLPLALIVLLLVFRTLVAASLPVGVGALAVLGGVAILMAVSHGVDISQYAINVCSLIGLGVAIDYSLFTVARYREELASGYPYEEALARAIAHAGKVVAFSALAVGLGLIALMFFNGSYLMTMGVGGAIVVALAGIFALTFLPALLAVLGPRINALKIPLPRLSTKVGLWHRISEWVMERPVLVMLPTLAVLLFLGSPFLKIRLASSDVSVLPPRLEAHRGFEDLKKSFPDEAATHFNIAVEFPTEPALTAERIGALYDVSAKLTKLPNVTKVRSLTYGDSRLDRAGYQRILMNPPAPFAARIEAGKAATSRGHVVIIQALSAAAPESDAARAIVNEIRADRAVADGTLVVGGESALDVDTTRYMLDRAPWAVGFVVIATFIVLSLLLGSVLLPLKAVLMNFLSLAGSFGALVYIFQEGHFISAPARPLEPALPVLLFCVLFGLSMDYEVLILSRMKEAYDRTKDNRLSVGEGLEKTGGLVTSAAAIMVSVFLAFASAEVVLIKAVGVGMAVAVALDATLVRVLLVPATMRLFGDANWWAPAWLRALRRKLGLEDHHAALPGAPRPANTLGSTELPHS